ncbi:MAG: glutamate--cysteine ligase [Deltaproteobacteria bacterium]|nr:glutamate--cysteine ligase [Deltaproteobacteria bacterium]
MLSHDDLLAPFYQAAKPTEQHRIGTEVERFGIDRTTGAPLQYAGVTADGPRGVLAVLEALTERYGWRPKAEKAGGPIIGLSRGAASITLEPGAQLELSGSPLRTVHEVCGELMEHLEELQGVDERLGIAWLGCGFHPLARQAELPWVPKERYGIMREYFPTQGAGGLDMMRRTATVQVNLDYVDEADAMRKLRVALRLAPIGTAIFANSPFYEGRLTSEYRSRRAAVWLDVDPGRAGLLPELMVPGRGFADYVEWALDAPMFLFKHNGQLIANTGQSFRSFWRNGFQGHQATAADWTHHLNTLFPEVRLKGYLEVRGADSLPRDLVCAVPALWTGLLYDERALDQAEQLCEALVPAELEALRLDVARDGLRARHRGLPIQGLAEQMIEIAQGGLERRARWDWHGQDEGRYLEPLVELVGSGRCPADRLAADWPEEADEQTRRTAIIRRAQL